MAKSTSETTATIQAPVDATNCPERDLHRSRLGSECPGCREVIPSLPVYTPEQMARFFPGSRLVEQSPHPFPQTAEVTELWKVYERECQILNDLTFEVEDLRQGGRLARGYDHEAHARGFRAEQQLEAAIAAREKQRVKVGEILLAIGAADRIRGMKAARALYLESYPDPDPKPSLLERATAAIRGDR